jgi:hypothetical protein
MKQAFFAIILCTLFSFPVLAQKFQTDREFDGLKGAVKAVVTEEAELKPVSGESVEENRKLRMSITYDANGNWTQWKNYDDNGDLRRSLVFSFIDQNRVAISEDVENENTLKRLRPVKGGRRVDPRYHYKFKYKYRVNGDRTEWTWHHPDGSLYLRYIFRLKGNQKTRLDYTANGKLIQKYEYTFDDKGNEIMMIYHVFPKMVYSSLDKVTYKSIPSPKGLTRLTGIFSNFGV